MIKIEFTKIHENYGEFRDAINLDDNHSFTDDEIETMKQQRFDNWVNFIETVLVVEPDPST